MTSPRHEDAARKFLRDNPSFWPLFCRFAFDAIGAGRDRFSVSMIVERIRWYSTIEARDKEGFKVNNNHRAYFARKWDADFPLHAGLFAKRETEI